jgi:ribosomal-protein-alanine N-acetyltransferase
MPEIRTARLVLAGLKPGDGQHVFAYASDPEVAKCTSWTPHQTLADSERFVGFVLGRCSAERNKIFHCWGIHIGSDNRVVGTIDFSQQSPTSGRIDYALSRNLWNKGIVTEAACAVLDWAFDNIPDLNAVESGGLTGNRGSMRVLEKCGMRLTRRYQHRFKKYGDEEMEVSEYLITRGQWAAMRQSSTQEAQATRSPTPDS